MKVCLTLKYKKINKKSKIHMYMFYMETLKTRHFEKYTEKVNI